MRRQGSLQEIIMVGKTEGCRKRGKSTMRLIDFIQEATGMHLQELSRVIEDRSLRTSLIQRITKSWS